jgi:hypothetical protein
LTLPNKSASKILRMPLFRNKHWSLILLVLTPTGLLLLFVFSLFSGPVSLISRHLIRDGMTKEEVISILGAPPGDYRTRTVLYGGLEQIAIPISAFESAKSGEFWAPSYSIKEWITNDGKISVTFDEHGKVIGKAFNKPKVSIGWLEEKWYSVLVSLGLRKPRMWCIN